MAGGFKFISTSEPNELRPDPSWGDRAIPGRAAAIVSLCLSCAAMVAVIVKSAGDYKTANPYLASVLEFVLLLGLAVDLLSVVIAIVALVISRGRHGRIALIVGVLVLVLPVALAYFVPVPGSSAWH